MSQLSVTFRLALDALLLRDRAYREMAAAPNPVARGLLLIVVIGVVAALANVVGTGLLGLTMPDIPAIQETVYDGIFDMPWADEIPAYELDEVRAGMESGFEISSQITELFVPSAGRALLGVLTTPIGLVLSWLVYGVLAHAGARALGGTGSLSQTYGTTALATAPQLLGVAKLLPYVNTAGLGVWGLVCTFLALKHAHDLSPGRAFWATLIPYLLGILALLLLGFMAAMFALTIGGLAS